MPRVSLSFHAPFSLYAFPLLSHAPCIVKQRKLQLHDDSLSPPPPPSVPPAKQSSPTIAGSALPISNGSSRDSSTWASRASPVQAVATSTAATAAVLPPPHAESSEVKVVEPPAFYFIRYPLQRQPFFSFLTRAPAPLLRLCNRESPLLNNMCGSTPSFPEMHYVTKQSPSSPCPPPSPAFSLVAIKSKRCSSTTALPSHCHCIQHAPLPSSTALRRCATSRSNASCSIELAVELEHDASARFALAGSVGVGHAAAASG